MTRKELKEQAKESLTGKYGDSIGIVLLLFFISFFCNFIFKRIGIFFHLSEDALEVLLNGCSFIISALFSLGYLSFFLKVSRDEKVEINELWSHFSYFIPYIIVTILIALFTTLWALLLIIPGIIAAYSYSMTYYIMLDHKDMKPMDAIRESKRIMNGHKMDLFVLQVSFLGWAILGIFTFGILYVWLIPYMNVTFAKFYDSIK